MGRVGSESTEWGRVGLGGVGEGLGMHWDAIGRVRPSGGGWGRVGPSGAVGHALGCN